MISKLTLTQSLEAHADNLRLANVFMVLGRGHDLHAAFEVLVSGKSPTAFGPSLQILKDKKRLVHTVDQLYFAIVRTAVTECLDLTRDYCRNTKQTKTLKAQNWFTVFRLIRNALNHNFHFEFKPDDCKELPATWKSITIDIGHNKTELTQKTLPSSVAIDWLAELDEFISKNLR